MRRTSSRCPCRSTMSSSSRSFSGSCTFPPRTSGVFCWRASLERSSSGRLPCWAASRSSTAFIGSSTRSRLSSRWARCACCSRSSNSAASSSRRAMSARRGSPAWFASVPSWTATASGGVNAAGASPRRSSLRSSSSKPPTSSSRSTPCPRCSRSRAIRCLHMART